MDELRQHLDDEARRVETAPDALEALKRRAGRRRVTRQIGTRALALAIAGGGFALAWDAFRGGPAGRPLVGPSMSPSPGSGPTLFVEFPGSLEDEAKDFSARLMDAGHDVVAGIHCPDCPIPEVTTIQYRAEAQAVAESIRREFLPGAELQPISWPAKRGDIYITLGADFPEVTASAIQVRILDGSLLAGATDAASTILEGEGYNVVAVQDAGTVYERTFISCAPHHEAEAELIRKAVFPKAEIRAELPDEKHDVTVHIGPDFYDDYAGQNLGASRQLLPFVRGFVDAFMKFRNAGGLVAETFLTDSGMADYSARPGWGGPLLYPEGGITQHRVVKFDKVEPNLVVVEVRLRLGSVGECAARTMFERLTIDLGASDLDGPVITSAELLDGDPTRCPPGGTG